MLKKMLRVSLVVALSGITFASCKGKDTNNEPAPQEKIETNKAEEVRAKATQREANIKAIAHTHLAGATEFYYKDGERISLVPLPSVQFVLYVLEEGATPASTDQLWTAYSKVLYRGKGVERTQEGRNVYARVDKTGKFDPSPLILKTEPFYTSSKDQSTIGQTDKVKVTLKSAEDLIHLQWFADKLTLDLVDSQGLKFSVSCKDSEYNSLIIADILRQDGIFGSVEPVFYISEN